MTHKDVTRYIKHLLATSWKHITPKQINSGNCDSFAEDLLTLVPKGDTFWGDELPNHKWECDPFGHCFFYFEEIQGDPSTGLYYDAECPKGVTKPELLPFYKSSKTHGLLFSKR